MFLSFYGLNEQPFGVTPDPRFLYLGTEHREAAASLFYGIETGRGFLSLIAKPGLGKTTLLFDLLERLRNSARTAFVFQTQCNSREFMRFLLREVGCQRQAGEDAVDLHDEFNRCLIQEAKAGRRFVLIIDEAQNLDSSVLETVRLLSDFETPRAKLLQIVLAGQPELADKLASPKLQQLRQRISLFTTLNPLSADEVEEYIHHRLEVAGRKNGSLFTSEAVNRIIDLSIGTPRIINNICFSALSLGFALQQKSIGHEIIDEVASDFDLGRMMCDARAAGGLSTAQRIPPAPVRQSNQELFSPAEALAFLRKFTEELNGMRKNMELS